jgi:hypothetical protein
MTATTTAAPAAAPKPVRQKYWATRAYHQFLRSRAKTPFAWGTHDCALFAADGIQAITGVDIAADFRGKYSTEAEAMALIQTVTGGATIADAAAWCAKKFGLAERVDKKGALAPLFAQRGDLVVFTAATGQPVAGLVHLSGQIVAVGENGLYRFPISKVLRSWRVG